MEENSIPRALKYKRFMGKVQWESEEDVGGEVSDGQCGGEMDDWFSLVTNT